jgi:glycosyltransferase involved in cell wall biosynthesis
MNGSWEHKMRNLFATADYIGTETGGGVVTRHEVYALQQLGGEVITIDASVINPAAYQQPNSPYVQDYIADSLILQILSQKINLAHFYSGMFAKTIMRLKAAGVKTTQTIAAHDVTLSREEFHKLGIPYDFPHLNNRTLWLTYIEGQLMVDKVICPSQISKKTVEVYGVKDAIVIPHGVIPPNDVMPIPNVFHVGYLGQPGPDKGLIYLFQAWSKLNLVGHRLLMAGKDIAQIAPLWNSLRNSGEVEFMGFVQNVAQLYNACSVYVQPSVTEGFGIEVLEAMAHGRPVIVSEGAGAADVVRHCTDGYVVPRRDPDAIADCIQTLKNDPALVASMGMQARARAMEYTWDRIIPQYHKLWLGILNGQPNP